ncbi:MAG: sucrose phosphorylase [Paenibacillus macerans]|uniref:sucrose phosphorylase n=1 Tax=Paenibacillus TaxID=44249 RepID=UPI0022E26C55|nr:sucrose phosphorylase [Paenibacillus macerans]MBS5912423.1 sucrose phosphorylase [Paenibacillus macerans]MDU5946639.1 sucrose phosphorylase [Paenibacillus macerans]MDU7472939.1 sucrose phosphorylase [Paenibacillus macerans]MED4953377.1 sucrose phosphorylase [Paenibacillus macerans]
MKIKNEAMLITYADSLGTNLKELNQVLDKHLQGVVGGVHLLPFYPSSGDRGFAPMDYTKVDPAFGDWSDVEQMSQKYYMMYDFMINHISRQSPYFQDFLEKKDESAYKDLFIRYKNFWPGGEPTPEDVDLIYKRKPRAPYVEVTFKDGSTEKVWCTFDEQQIDLDVTTDTTKKFIRDNLTFLAQKGASIIRLDAFAYANKKIGTNCFFVEPDIWDMLRYSEDIISPSGITVLPEIHEHYSIQLKIAEQDYYVYDFALPMLVLHALYSGQVHRLVHWLNICPRKQFTTLDTHDGIGVVDVKDLLSDEECEMTRESLYSQGANVKKIYSTEAYNNLDIYQINCTYYSALGNNDQSYLLARAIQCFAPGIPQIYYVGLLAGENDIELLERTKEGRNINRHYYTLEEIEREVERPVVKQLFRLLKFRNTCPAFDGTVEAEQADINNLRIIWKNGASEAKLEANLATKEFSIRYKDAETNWTLLM